MTLTSLSLHFGLYNSYTTKSCCNTLILLLVTKFFSVGVGGRIEVNSFVVLVRFYFHEFVACVMHKFASVSVHVMISFEVRGVLVSFYLTANTRPSPSPPPPPSQGILNIDEHSSQETREIKTSRLYVLSTIPSSRNFSFNPESARASFN